MRQNKHPIKDTYAMFISLEKHFFKVYFALDICFIVHHYGVHYGAHKLR